METPRSIAEKGFQGLTPLTPGSTLEHTLLRLLLNPSAWILSPATDSQRRLFSRIVRSSISIRHRRRSSSWVYVDEVGCLTKTTDTETGPGVFETALAYTDAGRMADNAALFKLVAKSVGMKYGIMPTFMAKPWGDVSFPFVER